MTFQESVLLVVMIIILCFTDAKADNSFDPWDYVESGKESGLSASEKISLPTFLLDKGIIFFSKFVSPVDGNRCFMYPTCAEYSREALEKHGFFAGILMTVDRLIHEGSEMEKAPIVKFGNTMRYFDPLTNNDFWWCGR